MVKNSNSQTTHSRWLPSTITMAFFTAFFFLIATLSLWVNNYVFNTDNFSRVVTTSITSESSRQALAGAIVDKALENRPVIKNIVGDSLEKVISGLLATSQFKTVLNTATTKLQTAVTSEHRQSVVVDLQGPKALIGKIFALIGSDQNTKLENANIPSKIVIIDKDNMPNLYSVGITVLWLGPLAVIVGLILALIPYFKWRTNFKYIILIQGTALWIMSSLSLLLQPLLRPVVLSEVANSNVRIVVGNLYDAFFLTLSGYINTLIIIGLIAMLLGGAMIAIKKLWPNQNFSFHF